MGKGNTGGPVAKTLPGASRLEEAYHRGYTQGITDAMRNFDKLVAGLRNPPPILVDASKLNPDALASLLAKAPEARSAPPSSEGSPSSSPLVSPAPAPKGEADNGN